MSILFYTRFCNIPNHAMQKTTNITEPLAEHPEYEIIWQLHQLVATEPHWDDRDTRRSPMVSVK